MGKLHRIVWIDNQIRGGLYPNCRIIAERFEISVRQASRELEYMRDSLHAPIKYCFQRRGYVYTDRTFALPSAILTEEQKASLSYLAGQYVSSGDRRNIELGETLKRLAGLSSEFYSSATGSPPSSSESLPESSTPRQISSAVSAIPLPPGEGMLHYVLLQRAAERQCKVTVRFAGEEQAELFHPYRILPFRRHYYVLGYIESFNDIRLLPLDCFESAKETGERFEFRPLFSGARFMLSLFRNPKKAVIRFAVPEYVETLGLPWRELDSGTFQVQFDDAHDLFAKLLACPADFELVSPHWCKNQFRARLQKIWNNHSSRT
ncbi:YafY family protein [Paenibacillus sp. J2TS4]|uniref:helix-turn-helix transcriptional regulator n=1 Tax=Paenibacillus sp. J2TS4 TaxID=2807194 RepID=UPI001AFECFD0|nr:WYL domain-containing protein [Paenibacillus sp. J2TS4]GIP36149.1 hypothetical protein J2TS4_53590 [Paenibacillus sp. J2TS4]